MTTAASFLNHMGDRPALYRTPSPPRRAVEPITPSAELRGSWTERGNTRATNLDQVQRQSNHTTSTLGDGTSNHRSSHGRSNSTIDTLATIALATSPTFAPLPYHPPSPKSRPNMSLFSSNSDERPAKRARSERDPSELPSARRHIMDTMTNDAELLLNLARPTNAPLGSHIKRVSIDESYHHYGADAMRHHRADFFHTGPGDGKFGNSSIDHIPHSRMRSRSDGSAFLLRPVISGMRPTTSSGTLPSIAWEDENEDNSFAGASRQQGLEEHRSTGTTTQESPTPRKTFDLTPKVEEEESDANQASCAECHLVRIALDTDGKNEDTWIGCDGCKCWFHILCAGFKNDRELRTVDKFICRKCQSVHGQTTFVRKSSRARTAIDYAGLNQGLVKAATDSLDHHYLEPIRQGKIRFHAESFPRIRPELVTAEYFERGNGWTEPVVIPACWNTREPAAKEDSGLENLIQEASTQEMFDELLEHLHEQDIETEETIDCGQDRLDMVIPQGLTVRAVAEMYGLEERLEVIDVKSQQGEDKIWNLQKWADYYESSEPNKVVRNVISLEVSQSKMGRLIKRPKVVRDLDLQDDVWPKEMMAVGDYPKVQFYCLMSVADCYTDFHIDFGGSSVYYHIIKGKKTFFFIPPKDKNLKKYEEWCNSPAQDTTFLGNQVKECYRVDLSEGDTMLIPSGWIHAVWTPENSLVIGGNFLTRLNYGMQIKILNVEKETKVPRKFRYPFFQKIQWYTAIKYLEDDPIPPSVLDAFIQDENYRFHRHYPIYYEFEEHTSPDPAGSPYHNSRFYSQAELEGLPELTKYLLRTALIASSYSVDGVTIEQRNAVRRSIPKLVTDPIDVIRRFGIWVAWKRGNEKAPQWTHPGVIESNPKVSLTEKRPAGRPSRRSERHVDSQRTYAERQAVQRPEEEVVVPPTPQFTSVTYAPSESETPGPVGLISESSVQETATPKPRSTPRSSGLGPKRVACDACRRRRIRCRHKDEPNDLIFGTQMMAINDISSGSGLSTPSSLAQDAVSALNSLAAIASQAGFQGNGMSGVEPFEESIALSSVMGASTTVANGLNDSSPDGTNGGKKGRSKACDDCRKSKRRCIHDEYGNIDPIKAQERSKPRGTASAKRPRPNEHDSMPITSKKTKQESTSPIMPSEFFSDNESKFTMTQGFLGNYSTTRQQLQEEPAKQSDAPIQPNMYASPPTFNAESVDTKDVNSMSVSSKPTVSLVSPPTSLVDEMDVVHDGDPLVSVETQPSTVLHATNSIPHHLSKQSNHLESFVPEVIVAKPAIQIPSPPMRRATPSKRPSSSHVKKSSPMVERHARNVASSLSPQQSKHTNHHLGYDTDAESLRLIREIQEEEFGLRRRRG
ncbi:hypothetical protein N7495_006159 [Penicillium taxi]|uniref:uncharacterized protein n=1 Tax=Penicillium taxi TaxID=168475 RepID=UPI002545BC10|nr:uncharacterized protein N7495_006159 [Penicillium taxi]KAJ5894468.1 hypothetical protein N7495_006159 [Penicillium taxi]